MEERKLTDLLADVKAYQKLGRNGVSVVTDIFIVAVVSFVILEVLVVTLKVAMSGIATLAIFLIGAAVIYLLLAGLARKNIAKTYKKYEGMTVCIDEEGWHQYKGQEQVLTKTWKEFWGIIPRDNYYLIAFDPYDQAMALDLNKLTDEEKKLLESANENRLPGVFQQLDASRIMQENTRGKCYDIVLTKELYEKRLKQQLSIFNYELKLWHIIMLFICWPILIMFLIYKAIVMKIGMSQQKKSYQKALDSGYATPEYVVLLDEDYGVKIFERFHVTELPWQKIYKVEERKEYFFFYKDKVRSFILPKEKMSQEDIMWLHKRRRKLA